MDERVQQAKLNVVCWEDSLGDWTIRKKPVCYLWNLVQMN